METKNYIAGEWLPSNEHIISINPSDTKDVIGKFSQCQLEQSDRALEAASHAQKIWQASGLEKRYAVLMKIGERLMKDSDDIGKLLSREEGKPHLEGRGEVYRAGQFFCYFAAQVLRQMGETADSVRPSIDIEIHREPIGNVLIISPWNFPIATAAWKIAPALAFGNSVLWKPSNLTPASSIRLAQIIAEQEIPSGLFNLLMGSGKVIGQHLIESPQVDAISFTGSVSTGQLIAQASIKNMAKLQMEMGSKNPLLVMDDADLDLAVNCAVGGAFGGTGQKCTASSRIIVHKRVHDAFVEQFIQATKKLRVDHALKEGTQIGPVVSEAQLLSNQAYVELAKKEGADLVCGGETLTRDTPGHYMQPAIFVNTDNNMRINQEEMFAPIACVIQAGSYEEGLAIANDSEFGLTAGIMTSSLSRANHFKKHSESGCVMINVPTAGTDYHVPFGGRKSSSFGSREQGRYAEEFYTQVKTTYQFSGELDAN